MPFRLKAGSAVRSCVISLAALVCAAPAAADVQHLVVSFNTLSVAVASHADGGSSIAWVAEEQEDFQALFLQRFDSEGQPVSARVPVASGNVGYGELQVTVDAAENVLVAWIAHLGEPEIIDQYTAAAYSPAGALLWGPAAISAPTTSLRRTAFLTVAPAPGGGWVAGWLDLPQVTSPLGTAQARRLDPASGAAAIFDLSDPVHPRPFTYFTLAGSATKVLASWSESVHAGPSAFDTFSLFGRLLDAQGHPVAPARALGVTAVREGGLSQLVSAGFGDDRFLLAWKSQAGAGAPVPIGALALTGDVPSEPAFVVHTSAANSWSPLDLVVDRAGRALIAWGEPHFGSDQTFFYRFAATGAALSEPEAVSFYSGYISGILPALGTSADGHWLVAWVRGLDEESPAGVDGILGTFADGCATEPHALCLTGNRFRVTATYHDHLGRDGVGYAAPLTSESGTFWFFYPASVELILKVVDACAHPDFGNFWVFASGLTDVQVHLEVVDTWTGATWERDTNLGEPFPPALDTAAFDTCDATPAFAEH